jgi:hypothetical protein
MNKLESDTAALACLEGCVHTETGTTARKHVSKIKALDSDEFDNFMRFKMTTIVLYDSVYTE